MNTLYKTDHLKLFYKPTIITVLTTDHGFFTDDAGNHIGKIINIEFIIDTAGNRIYTCRYPKVIQYFPENYS